MTAFVPGAVWKPFEMIVETGKVREFAKATKSDHPEYDSSWTPVSPPTFLAAASFWMGPDNSPLIGSDLDFSKILHGAEEFVFHGEPPSAGTRLVGTVRVDNVYTKQGRRGGTMRFIEMACEYRNATGDLVAEVRSTMIETGQVVGKE